MGGTVPVWVISLFIFMYFSTLLRHPGALERGLTVPTVKLGSVCSSNEHRTGLLPPSGVLADWLVLQKICDVIQHLQSLVLYLFQHHVATGLVPGQTGIACSITHLRSMSMCSAWQPFVSNISYCGTSDTKSYCHVCVQYT